MEQEPDSVGVVIVDDHAVFRSVAREVIEATPGFTPIGEVGSGEEALTVVDQREPRLVLVDVRIPGMDGIEIAKRIKTTHPEVVVVLISIQNPQEIPVDAAAAGAEALVRKQDFGPALLRRLWIDHGSAA